MLTLPLFTINTVGTAACSCFYESHFRDKTFDKIMNLFSTRHFWRCLGLTVTMLATYAAQTKQRAVVFISTNFYTQFDHHFLFTEYVDLCLRLKVDVLIIKAISKFASSYLGDTIMKFLFFHRAC
jgi:hypothetical protein